jgi:hypothetical protein
LCDVLELEVDGLKEHLVIVNRTKGTKISVNLNLSSIEKEQVLAGGKLALIKVKQNKK